MYYRRNTTSSISIIVSQDFRSYTFLAILIVLKMISARDRNLIFILGQAEGTNQYIPSPNGNLIKL